MQNKQQELNLLRKCLLDPESAYSFWKFSTSKYTEDDFNFINEIIPAVDFKFSKGMLFEEEIYYIVTEPKQFSSNIGSHIYPDKEKQKPIRIREGFCYLISDGEYQKIGITTTNIKNRVQQIQTGNPRKISIVAEYEVKTDVFYVEKRLHIHFDKYRQSGEWFRECVDKQEFIRLCEKYDRQTESN